MKRLLLAAAAIGVFALPGLAQAQELGGFVGWQLGTNKVSFLGGEAGLKSSLNYGAELNFPVNRGGSFVLLWNHQSTDLDVNNFGGVREDRPVSVNYFHAGGMMEFPQDNLRPFVMFTLGTTWLSPADSNVSDEWRFSMMLGGGLKVDMSERVGLRGQGRLWATTISTSGGFWCGTGGCSVGLGGYGVWSLEMSAGMYIKFGN
jgi:Outer membrane protein beta-barrel domain